VSAPKLVNPNTRPVNASPRALLTWELGGGGHFVPTLRLAAALKRRGFQVDFAALRPHAIPTSEKSFDRLFQAPVLPRTTRIERHFGPMGPVARSYVEVLMDHEFDFPLVAYRQVQAWRSLFDLARPDMLIADFSPGAVLAARGRIPTVAFGSPFCVPSGDKGHFPPFFSDHPVSTENEIAVLSGVRTALEEQGEAGPNDLVEAIVPPVQFPQGFTELDPYAACRTEELLPPIVEQCAVDAGTGTDVLVYLPRELKTYPAIIETLLALEGPVRIDESDMNPDTRRRLSEGGVRIESEIFDSNKMASSGSLVVSHGGFHTVVRALLAGVPQVIVAGDAEKLMHAQAVKRLGVGTGINLNRLTSLALQDAIETVTGDPEYAARARALAPEFRRRHIGDTIETIADRILGLIT
jgi:rhamnosyltransferase subunit B